MVVFELFTRVPLVDLGSSYAKGQLILFEGSVGE